MRRLQKPRAYYRQDLGRILTAEELELHAEAIDVAHDQARTYAKKSPRLANMSRRTADGDLFISLYKGKRNAVRDLKERVRAKLTDVTAALCQYCGLPAPETLDHYIEKSKIPELALYARNLVPSCSRCNLVRGPTFSDSGQRRIVHFYDDDVDEFPLLLIAEIYFQGPTDALPVASYKVKQHSSKQAALYREHFAALGLAERYSTQAAPLLLDYHDKFRSCEIEFIRTELVEQEGRLTVRYGRNNYRSALCSALSSTLKALEWLAGER